MARHASRFLPALALAVIMAASANAMFMRPSAAPIDRLIANTEAYIKEHPKDASGTGDGTACSKLDEFVSFFLHAHSIILKTFVITAPINATTTPATTRIIVNATFWKSACLFLSTAKFPLQLGHVLAVFEIIRPHSGHLIIIFLLH